MTTASPPAWSPDWSKVSEQIACPLCDYDLRGLAESRCPECGYRFEWSDLFDPARRKHPYLFEHHPERNIASFFHTKIEGTMPWRFWRTLKPTQPSSPRRLLLYWIICMTFAVMLPLGDFGRYWVMNGRDAERERARLTSQLSAPRNSAIVQRFGSVAKAVDAIVPPPWTYLHLTRCWNNYLKSARTIGITCGIAYVCWPWLTIAALMVFRTSMRRAQIRSIHVVRCALYSCDSPVIAAALMLLVYPLNASRYYVGPLTGPASFAFSTELVSIALAALLFAMLTLYKLGFAYRQYLRFPHAWSTAILSQVVVVLAILGVATRTVATW